MVSDKASGRAPLRVCVVEGPHGGLGRRLRQAGMKVERLATDPQALADMLSRRNPPLAVVDATHLSLERLAALARRHPGVRVVAVGASPSAPAAARLLAAGAWSCVRAPADTLSVPSAAVRSLTRREREVLRHVGTGCDNVQIAALLGITERTIRAHIGNLYRKLGSPNRVALALKAATA